MKLSIHLHPHVLRTSCVWICLWFVLSIPAHAQTPATSIPLLLPSAIAYDSQGNLYIAEMGNHAIRKVDGAGNITTIAGTGTQGYDGDHAQANLALLDSPQGLAVSGTSLYIADTHNHRIRKVDLSSGIIMTVAGNSSAGAAGDDGPAISASLDRPVALAVGAKGDLFIADSGSHRIRRIDAITEIITTVAGSGTQGYEGDQAQATAALLDSPQGLAVDSSGNLFLADTHNHRVRRIDAGSRIITTLAGTGAFGYSGDSDSARSAMLALPQGLSIDAQGNVYLTDSANHRIRRIDATTGIITTTAGNGTQGFSGDGSAPAAASLDSPRSISATSGFVTVADTANQRVRQTTPSSIQTIAGLSSSEVSSISIQGDSFIAYGSGHLTASLTSAIGATGPVIFLDQFSGNTNTAATIPISSGAAVFDTSQLPVGQHVITASYGGDPSHSAAQSAAFPLTINPLPVTATISPASLQYGETLPALLGALSGVLPRDQSSVSGQFSAETSQHPSAGVYPVGVTLTGPAAGNYTLSASPTLTITKAPTATTLAATTEALVSAANAAAGQPVLLTVQVASATTGTPTGTVIVSDGATLLGAGSTDSSGHLTFTTSSLQAGPHNLTAAYSGDANFLSSISPTALFTISAPPSGGSDFTLAPGGKTTQAISSGGSADFSFNIQVQGSLSGPITLSAIGLPHLATASFNPGEIEPGTSGSSFTMTIKTQKATQLSRVGGSSVFAVLLPFAVFVVGKRRRGIAPVLSLVLCTGTLMMLTGCGDRVRPEGDVPGSTKTYTITVTGTSVDAGGTTLRHNATVTLTLQAEG